MFVFSWEMSHRPALSLIELLISLVIIALVLSLTSGVLFQGMIFSEKLTDDAYLLDQADYALRSLEGDLAQVVALEEPQAAGEFLRCRLQLVSTIDKVDWLDVSERLLVYRIDPGQNRMKSQIYRREEGFMGGKEQPVAQLYRPHVEGDRARVEVMYYDRRYQQIADPDKARYVQIRIHIGRAGKEDLVRQRSMSLENVSIYERRGA